MNRLMCVKISHGSVIKNKLKKFGLIQPILLTILIIISPISSAWLLDFKNRTADFAAERKKAEQKMMRELNANPNSGIVKPLSI